MKTLPLSILASLAFASVGVAQEITYSTTFDTLPSGISLSGATSATPGVTGVSGDWVTTDQNQDDSVLSDSSPLAQYVGDQWAIMGGAAVPNAGTGPSQTSSELWYPVQLAHNFQISMEFDITTSSVAYPNDDTFGMTFRNTSGGLLFQVLFKPDSSSPSTTLDAEWNNGGSEQSTDISISRNSVYTLNIDGSLDDGTFQTAISESTTSTEGTFDGTLTPGATLGEAGVTWVEQSPGTYGSNAIAFNNYEAVPEPSVDAFLLGSAGMGLAWLLRRRRMA